MRKADLVNRISKDTGIPRVDVLLSIENMLEVIKETLSEGENVYLRGFGSFILKKRAAKIGRDIQKNTAIKIPEHYIPAFRPSQQFSDDIKSKKVTPKK